MLNWDEYFINIMDTVATKSKDTNTKIGCVLVGADREIRSTGYNSFPRGLDDNVKKRFERPLKYKFFEHAERNAIYNAARIGVSVKGCVSYQSWLPCTDCARGLINAGITEIVYDCRPGNPWLARTDKIWDEDMAISKEMLSECGVKIRQYEGNKPKEKPVA